jgi:hypothetical protein
MGKGKRPGAVWEMNPKGLGLGSGFGNYSTCYWYVCRFLVTFSYDLKTLSADWRGPASGC